MFAARTVHDSLCLRFVGKAGDLQGIYVIVNNFLPFLLTIPILIVFQPSPPPWQGWLAMRQRRFVLQERYDRKNGDWTNEGLVTNVCQAMSI